MAMTRAQILRRLPRLEGPTDGLNIDGDWGSGNLAVMPCYAGNYFTDAYLAVLKSLPAVAKVAAIIGDVPTIGPAPKEWTAVAKRKYSPVTAIKKSPWPTQGQILLVCDHGEALTSPAKLRRLMELTECDQIGCPIVRGTIPFDQPIAALKDGKPVGFLAQMTR